MKMTSMKHIYVYTFKFNILLYMISQDPIRRVKITVPDHLQTQGEKRMRNNSEYYYAILATNLGIFL